MSKQVQEAHIAATCTPVSKAPRGMFRNTQLGNVERQNIW